MSEHLTLPGTAWTGQLTLPTAQRAPAVVLFHEWWGLNAHMLDVAQRLANDGFVVWTPDLYHGFSTKDPAEAADAMNKLAFADAVIEVEAALGWLQTHPRTTGRTGCIGFCMGGAFSVYSAARLTELAAAAVFYGIPDPKKTDFRAIGCPVIAHFATRDGWASVERAEAMRDRVLAAGGSFELHVYDADHAFVNDTRPEVYSPDAAALAWSRTVDFFHTNLG